MTVAGTLLALDWGAAKIGYATADGEGRAITPRGAIRRKDPPGAWKAGRHDLEALREVIRTYEISAIVLGCPRLPGGRSAESTAEAVALGERLGKELGMNITLRDESLTSWEARSRGTGSADDAEAAAVLLEDHFHALRRSSPDPRRGNVKIVLAGVLVVLVGAGLWGLQRARSFYSQPLSAHLSEKLRNDPKPALLVDVRPGMNFHQLRKVLDERGLKVDDLAFRFWLRAEGARYVLKPGEYRIRKEATLAQAFRDIGTGAQILHKLTVKEGHNLWDIENELKLAFGPRMTEEAELEALVLGTDPEPENPAAKKVSETFWKLVADRKLIDEMGAKPGPGGRQTLEGFLFPETYSFRKYESPKVVVDAMLEQFRARALPILQSHPSWGSTPEGRYRLLTLASMVEKESGDKEEQPIIASVFWNRLQKKMRMESDPTTIYGLMPSFDGNLRRDDLRSPSPYNTYTLPELPAGPIANPGETALRAVVNPAFTDYIFFVAKGNGQHVFSRDYKTHSAYVDEYQRKRKEPAPALTGEKQPQPRAPTVPVVSGSKKSRSQPKSEPRTRQK